MQVYTPEEELLRLREIDEALEQEQYRSMLELQIGQRHVDGLSEKVVELQAQLRIADADAAAMKQEIGACRNVAAILERQKQDSLREAALLRDEIVALRTKIEQRDVERAAPRRRRRSSTWRGGGRRNEREWRRHCGPSTALRKKQSASGPMRVRCCRISSEKAQEEVERQAQELRAVRARLDDVE